MLVINLAGARGIEPRSRVLETLILAVVLCPFVGAEIPASVIKYSLLAANLKPITSSTESQRPELKLLTPWFYFVATKVLFGFRLYSNHALYRTILL